MQFREYLSIRSVYFMAHQRELAPEMIKGSQYSLSSSIW